MSNRARFANFVLLSGIIFFALIFLYAFLKRDSYPTGSMYKYYFISIFFLVVLVVVLKRCKDEAKVKIALLFFSIGISIYMIEILLVSLSLTLFKPEDVPTKRNKLARKKGLTIDSRNTYQMLMDLRKKGINAYPQVDPYSKIYDDGLDFKGIKIYPLGAISNKTTVFCKENAVGRFVIYETDEYGFRNPTALYNRASFDIVLIGDSFTHGICVTAGEDIAGWLRKKDKLVLNLGMRASGPLIELAILSEYAKPFQPKFVFWLYYEGNDLSGLDHERKSPTLMKYLEKSFSQNLIHRQNLIDNALIADVENQIRRVKKKKYKKDSEVDKTKSNIPMSKITKQVMILHRLRLKLGQLNAHCLFNIDPLIYDILTQAKSRVEDWGGHLYFVYLPSHYRYRSGRYKSDFCRKHYFNLQKEKIISSAKELKIDVIDMTEHFDSQHDPLSLFPYIGGHYNSKGYKLVAQKIEEHIVSFP